MINSNEKLLPGNVVMWRNRFYTLTKGDIYSMDYLRNFYSPIPLTPEILVQWCGWRTAGNKHILYIGNIGLIINLSRGILVISDTDGDMVNVAFPEHLHTLQNLIYFLSGEEMPVNIPNN